VVHKALENGCVTCHNPHSTDGPRLLNEASIASLCQSCHTSLANHFHPTSSAKPDPRTGQPMTCTSCHRPHAAPFKGLLTHEPERELCIQCHDPTMAPPPKK
jgi:predicted CXXCH cytochrome family protein